jgi:outer membrane protein OmpA-like peptidoglycan-associated protein
MTARLLAATCLLGLGLLLSLGPGRLAPHVEASIERRVDKALAGEGLDFALAEAEGRDVTLRGYASDPDLKSGAFEIASGVAGVRTVTNHIRLATLRTAGDEQSTPAQDVSRPGAANILPAPWQDPDLNRDVRADYEHRVDYMPMISKEPLHGVDELTGSTCQELLTELMKNGTIRFEINRSTISTDSHKLLTQIAKTILRCPSEGLVEIGGHTDDSGQPAYNLHLSQLRAEAVVNFLTGQGVSEVKLQAKGYGDTHPLADNSTRSGRARNRRIEFTVNAQQGSQH